VLCCICLAVAEASKLVASAGLLDLLLLLLLLATLAALIAPLILWLRRQRKKNPVDQEANDAATSSTLVSSDDGVPPSSLWTPGPTVSPSDRRPPAANGGVPGHASDMPLPDLNEILLARSMMFSSGAGNGRGPQSTTPWSNGTIRETPPSQMAAARPSIIPAGSGNAGQTRQRSSGGVGNYRASPPPIPWSNGLIGTPSPNRDAARTSMVSAGAGNSAVPPQLPPMRRAAGGAGNSRPALPQSTPWSNGTIRMASPHRLGGFGPERPRPAGPSGRHFYLPPQPHPEPRGFAPASRIVPTPLKRTWGRAKGRIGAAVANAHHRN